MEKNFLETINEAGIDSFGKEVFEDRKKEIKKKRIRILVILSIILIIAGIGIAIFQNRKITVPDFTGETMESLNMWVKENNYPSENLIISYQFDASSEENVILSQSVSGRVRLKQNIVLTVSKGADPEELIEVPDLENMTYDEIKSWVEENALTGVSMSKEYSSTVEENHVISVNFKNTEKDEFTRGSKMEIVLSKGSEPLGKVTMADLTGQRLEDVIAWCEKNNLALETSEAFSDKVEKNCIISQSVAKNEKIDGGESISVVVSKGASVIIPDFVSDVISEAEEWGALNNTNVVFRYLYNDSAVKDRIVSQSIAAGSEVEADTPLIVTVSLGQPMLDSFIGQDVDMLRQWINDVNTKGAHISLNIADGVYYSDTVQRDCIISQSEKGFVNIGADITVVVSSGSRVYINWLSEDTGIDEMKEYANQYGLNCTYVYEAGGEAGRIKGLMVNSQSISNNTYVSGEDLITVVVYAGS